jgi:hypothetical protein
VDNLSSGYREAKSNSPDTQDPIIKAIPNDMIEGAAVLRKMKTVKDKKKVSKFANNSGASMSDVTSELQTDSDAQSSNNKVVPQL